MSEKEIIQIDAAGNAPAFLEKLEALFKSIEKGQDGAQSKLKDMLNIVERLSQLTASFRAAAAAGTPNYLAGLQANQERRAQVVASNAPEARMIAERLQMDENYRRLKAGYLGKELNQQFDAREKEAARETAAQLKEEENHRRLKAGYLGKELNQQFDAQEKEAAREAAAKIAKEKETQAYLLKVQLNSAKMAATETDKIYKAQQAQLAKVAPKTPAEKGAGVIQNVLGDSGAHLLLIQAALQANYALLNGVENGIVNSISFAVELEQDMHNLQAITQSTNADMVDLQKTFINIANSTRFSATEIAKAAVEMGQAGLSTAEIKNSIKAIALLATATGEDFGKTVDLTTSIIGVFNIEAGQMAMVANTVTQALNLSKLNLEKLTLGLQYVGNTAVNAGVSFEEVTAALGAMSDAGIRSGSTMGTGLRGILTNIEKPTKAFRERLADLGLTMSDVDLQSKGLFGVLTTLADAGFTATDAVKSFDIRTAAAFTALSSHLTTMTELQLSFVNSRAAIDANNIQMDTASSQTKVLGSSIQTLLAGALQPLLIVWKDMAKVLSVVFQSLAPMAPLLGVIAGVALSAGAALGLMWGAKLITGGFNLVKLLATLNASFVGLTAVEIEAAIAAGALEFALGPVGWALLIGSALGATFALVGLTSQAFTAAGALDQLRTSEQTVAGEATKYAEQIGIISDKIQELQNRSGVLNQNQVLLAVTAANVKDQFSEMGLVGASTTNTVNGLVTALEALRVKLTNNYILKLSADSGDLAKLSVFYGEQAKKDQAAVVGTFVPVQRYQGGNIDPRALAIRSAAGGSQRTVEQAKDLNSQARALSTEFSAKQALQDGNLSATDQYNQRYIAALVSATDKLLASTQNKASTDLLINQNSEKMADAQSSVSLGYLLLNNALTKTTGSMNAALTGIGKAHQGNTPEAQLARDADGQVALKKYSILFDMLDTGVSALVKSRLITATTGNGLSQQVAAHRGDLITATGTLTDEAAKAHAQEAMDKEHLLAMQQANTLAEIENRFGTGSYQVARLKVAQERDLLIAKQATEKSTVTAQAAELAAFDIAHKIGTQAQFEADKAAAKLSSAQKIIAPLEAEAKINAIILQYGEGSIQVKQAQVKAEKDLWIATNITGQYTGVIADKMIASYDAAHELSNLNISAGIDGAVTSAAQLAVQLGSSLAIAQMIMNLGGSGPGNPIVFDPRDPHYNKAQADMASAAAGMAEVRARTNHIVNYVSPEPLKKPKGGGSGGSPNKADNSFVSSLSGSLDSALANPSDKNQRALIDHVMQTAQAELKNVQGKIAALSGKDKSLKQQTALNKLLKDQGDLQQFIKDGDDKIGESLGRQGKLYLNLNALMKDFAQQNLNINVVLKSGITSVLSEWQGAFSELFTSIAEGTKSGKDALRDFAISAIKSLEGLVAKLLAVYAMKAILGAFGGTVGGTNIASQLLGMVSGGKGMAQGGKVNGGVDRDSVAATLMPDEFVISAPAARAIGYDKLDQLNNAGISQQKANPITGVAHTLALPAQPPINLWMAPPDQRPIPGPNDIIAVITDDMARGGATKKLIKTFQREG